MGGGRRSGGRRDGGAGDGDGCTVAEGRLGTIGGLGSEGSYETFGHSL